MPKHAQSDPGSTGRKEVGTSAETLTAKQTTYDFGMTIYADGGNDDNVFIGFDNTITADDDDDTDGFPLAAGASIYLPNVRPDQIWCIAESGTQKLWFIGQ